MAAIDIVILVFVIWGFVRGFMKGAIMTAATLTAFCLGIFLGMRFSKDLAGFIASWSNSTSPYINLISFALIFVCILALVFLVAKIVEKFVTTISLGIVNKLLGGVLGTLKFALLASILFYAVDKVEKSVEIIPIEMKNQSLFYSPLAKLALVIIPGASENKLESLVPNVDSLIIKGKKAIGK